MATDSYRHKTATRRNNPTPETESMMTDEDRKPKPFTIKRHKIATPVLTWDRQGESSSLSGDDAEDALLRMEALPLYVREKVSPVDFVNQLRKPDSGVQVSMDDFNGLPEGADPLNFYEHSGNWQNRLIHGDSADVMKSLIAKDGLAGQVQMIYFDPPYGMSYDSNFQPTTYDIDKKDKPSSVPAGDGLPVKAFRDTYRNGVHSYLDGVHKQVTLAHELLSDSGSLFVQIGDENVHRMALVLDEIFGADNRVTSIPFATSASGDSKLIPTVVHYLLWYARDISQVKYRHLYEHMDKKADKIAYMSSYVMVELDDGSSRNLTAEELEDPDKRLPDGTRLFRRVGLTSQGVSQTGKSEPYEWNGVTYHCDANRHWSVSYEALDELARMNRLVVAETGGSLKWKQYEDEIPGKKLTNIWPEQAYPSGKRYIVQTSDKIIARCMLMSTDPGDLVFDPTCGSGVTADMAEHWGRRWVTCDVQRVAIAIARSHLLSKIFPWHRTRDGGTDPAAGLVESVVPYVTAKTLAEGTWDDPQNAVRLVDRTDVDKKRARICSAFTVESISPYTYLSLEDGDAGELPTADPTDAETLLQLLRNTPVCDASGRPVFDVVETVPWPDTKLVGYGARCASESRDAEFTAGVMIAAADATVTIEVARRAAVEARDNDPNCENLVIIGYDFEAGIPPAVGPVHVQRVVASRDLRLPETIKRSADGGSFVLLAEPDVILDTTDEGITVELLGCDTYDPAVNRSRGYGTDEVECWMLDTNHDGFSFRVRCAYFPNGFRKGSDIKKLIAKIPRRERDEAALDNIQSTVSQPFAPPDPGRNIAIKVITTTGAEMTTTIDEGW